MRVPWTSSSGQIYNKALHCLSSRARKKVVKCREFHIDDVFPTVLPVQPHSKIARVQQFPLKGVLRLPVSTPQPGNTLSANVYNGFREASHPRVWRLLY